MAELDKQRTEMMNKAAATIQRRVRGHFARSYFIKCKQAVITMQVREKRHIELSPGSINARARFHRDCIPICSPPGCLETLLAVLVCRSKIVAWRENAGVHIHKAADSRFGRAGSGTISELASWRVCLGGTPRAPGGGGRGRGR